MSKQTLYQVASGHSKRAIQRLAELMESKNENVALGASRALLDKCLPDLKQEDFNMSEKLQSPLVVIDLANKEVTH